MQCPLNFTIHFLGPKPCLVTLFTLDFISTYMYVNLFFFVIFLLIRFSHRPVQLSSYVNKNADITEDIRIKILKCDRDQVKLPHACTGMWNV